MGLTQEVDNNRKVMSNVRFETLRLLQSGLTVTQLAKVRKVSRASVYKVINTLLEIGYLETIDNSYSLTLKGIEGLHSFVGLRYNLRQHNFHIKFKVLESPKNWDKKRNEFRKLPYFNKRIKLKNNEQDLFNYGSLMIKTTTKHIIVKIPTIYAKDIEEATLQTFDILESTYPKIEKLFKVKLIKNYKACVEVICQEYARLNDVLAKMYRAEGKQLLITGDDGKIWMITDKSFNGDEREYIHTNKAPEDEEAISKSMNILRDNPTIMQDNKKEIVNLKGVFPAMKEYNENIKLHTSVNLENKELLKQNIQLSKINQDLSRQQLETNKQMKNLLLKLNNKL
jgi:DNA-binding PadR family transcriptional regulator